MGKNFSISIGNNGSIIALQSGKKIIKKIFINSLNAAARTELDPLFRKHKNVKIHIVLDNIGQSYNHKRFPNVNFFDMLSMVKRKYNNEIPKNDLKGKIFLGKRADTKEWEWLFVSSPIDALLKDWVSYIDELPNILSGIYMAPLEMENMLKKMYLKIPEIKHRTTKWVLLVLNNKVSDLRQIAFYNGKLIFTRILSSDINAENIGNKISVDITRTIEYLKRYSQKFDMKDLTVITVTNNAMKLSLDQVNISPIGLVNLTAGNVALKMGYSKNVSINEEYADILLRDFILNNRKKLTFTTSDMKILRNVFLFSSILNMLFIIFLTIVIGLVGTLFVNTIRYRTQINDLEKAIERDRTRLKNEREKEFGKEYENIDEIIDMSAAYVLSRDVGKKYMDTFSKIATSQAGFANTLRVSWQLLNYSENVRNAKPKMEIEISQHLVNTTGKIDSLFKIYDGYSSVFKSNFKDYIVNISELPRNIEYNKKHFTFPITIKLREM